MQKIVLGTAQLGLEYGISNYSGKPTQESANQIIRAALKNNILYFDTAQRYGNSELVLGRALSKSHECETNIITKLDPKYSLSSNPSEIIDSVKESLNKLNIKSFYGLLLHRPLSISEWNSGFSKVVSDLKKMKLIKYFGISMANYIKELYSIIDLDEIEIVQVPFNIWDRRVLESGLLKKFYRKKKRIFIRSVFLQGLAFIENNKIPNKLNYLIPMVNSARKFCIEHHIEIPHFCIQYVISRCPNSFILFGAETKEQVEKNISLFNDTVSEDVFKEWEQTYSFNEKNIVPSLWT